jgi:alternate signal-mediated exported protein
MNKLTKGAIAGAAGIALLLGGAGSFALWNSTATINAGVVSAGTLKLNTQPGTWVDKTFGANNKTIASINNFRLAPGTTVQYTQVFDIVATGNHLTATLSLDPSSIEGYDLANYADVTFTGPLALDTGFTAVITGSQTVTAVVTVKLPAGTAVDNRSQGTTLDLSHLKFNLEQTAPPTSGLPGGSLPPLTL